jgi:hypothetical protein
MQQRHIEESDSMSEITNSDNSVSQPDFFTYGQLSLNQATWELEPPSYRIKSCGTSNNRQEDFDMWC